MPQMHLLCVFDMQNNFTLTCVGLLSDVSNIVSYLCPFKTVLGWPERETARVQLSTPLNGLLCVCFVKQDRLEGSIQCRLRVG